MTMDLPEGFEAEIILNNEQQLNFRSDDLGPELKVKGVDFEITYNLLLFLDIRKKRINAVSYRVDWKSEKTSDHFKQIQEIHRRVESGYKQLMADIGLYHYVVFSKDSICFYCFDDQTLYNASGTKDTGGKNKGEDRKRSINGEAYFLPPSLSNLIEELVTAPYNSFPSKDYSLHTSARDLDTSIEATLLTSYGKGIRYVGDPPFWTKATPAELTERLSAELAKREQEKPKKSKKSKKPDKNFTFKDIFRSLCVRQQFDFSAYCPDNQPKVFYIQNRTAATEDIMRYFGLYPFEAHGQDTAEKSSFSEASVVEHYCAYGQKFDNMQMLWARLNTAAASSIKDTFEAQRFVSGSLDGTTRAETNQDLHDLGWDRRTHDVWTMQLRLICEKISRLLEGQVDESMECGQLFLGCSTDVTPNMLYDYLAAMLLTRIYLSIPTDTSEHRKQKAIFQRNLRSMILSRLRMGDGHEPITKEDIQELIDEIQNVALSLSAREYVYGELQKLIDNLPKQQYDDSITPQPTDTKRLC